MDLLKFSTPSGAPDWFAKFLEYYNSETANQSFTVNSETVEVLDGKIFATSGNMVTVVSGRCKLNLLEKKPGISNYAVSLPSWVVLSAPRPGGAISVAKPAYSLDTPKRGDLVKLGDSLSTRQILNVRIFSSHIELEVSGGALVLNAGERVQLAKGTITLQKLVGLI